jgi:hypothetical protein
VSKKLIIITAAAGLSSFAGMFALAWFTKPTPQIQGPEAAQATPSDREADLKLTQPQMLPAGDIAPVDAKMKKTMTERQLKSLVYEIREKIQEYDRKLRDLEVRERRLQTAQDTSKKDIEELNNLRIELASTVAILKNEQDKLQKSRLEIAQTEKKNLMSIALAYDKMDATSAGEILTNISQAENAAADDAVKILYYMSERTKAKVLASIAETEPSISAYFCQQLKQIVESGQL